MMVPDFNNDGDLDPWEGAVADAWYRHECHRSRVTRPHRPHRGCGCGNVAVGCLLILLFAFAVAALFISVSR